MRRQVKFGEGRLIFSVPRPLPTTLKTEERQVPRAAGSQSAGLLHIGFILKHPFVDRSRLRVLTALQTLQRTRECQKWATGPGRVPADVMALPGGERSAIVYTREAQHLAQHSASSDP